MTRVPQNPCETRRSLALIRDIKSPGKSFESFLSRITFSKFLQPFSFQPNSNEIASFAFLTDRLELGSRWKSFVRRFCYFIRNFNSDYANANTHHSSRVSISALLLLAIPFHSRLLLRAILFQPFEIESLKLMGGREFETRDIIGAYVKI